MLYLDASLLVAALTNEAASKSDGLSAAKPVTFRRRGVLRCRHLQPDLREKHPAGPSGETRNRASLALAAHTRISPDLK
jgi:hypothetical protein